ncbi:MAG: InlB B-repeat-containing protein [Erysipelotrichaceae bacterium]
MSKKKKLIIGGVIAVILIVLALVLFILPSKDKTYTVSFDTDGGTEIASLTVSENSQLVLPQDPVKEGYVFVEWQLDGVKVSNGFIVTKDITLKAIYQSEEEIIEYVTVTFDSAGGSAVETLTLQKGSELTLPENPTREGYTFDKWVDDDGNEVTDGFVLESDLTLHASWTENKPTTVAVSSISLNKSSLNLIIGQSGSLTATVSPSDASDKSVKWSTSDSSVITVDSKGNVTAVGIGSATITATASNGKKATATVTSNVESVSITVTKAYISKYNGATDSTTVTVSTSPKVDSKYLTVSYPDATGANAVAYATNNGDGTYTFTARDNWSSSQVAIKITATVGSKSADGTIFVEPELSLTYFGGSASDNSVTIKSGETLGIVGNLQFMFRIKDTKSLVSDSSYSTSERKLSLTLNNTYSNPEGFQIEIKSNAGQQKTVVVTVNP